MRKKRTILWLSLLLLVLAGIGWGWHLYDKPHRSAAGISPDLTITADSLYHRYQSDERSADQRSLPASAPVNATGRRLGQVHRTRRRLHLCRCARRKRWRIAL